MSSDVPVGSTSPLLYLDVRPLLEAGADPLEEILARVEQLATDGLLRLTAPFRPTPLITLLSQRGYRVSCAQADTQRWELEILAADAPAIEDYRDLEAPEPLEQTLLHVTPLPPGAAFLVRVPRLPKLLFPLLEERNLDWESLEEPDGTAIIHIRRPAQA